MADKTGIERHIELLQKKHKAVVGVASAPLDILDYPVGEVSGSEMPVVLVFPQEGAWRHEGFRLKRHDRTYKVLVIVANVGDGIDNESMLLGIQLLQRFGDLYVNDDTQSLKGSGPQITMKATNEDVIDTGWDDESVVFYADTPYRGFEFRVGVYEKWEG